MYFIFGENEKCELMCKHRRKSQAIFNHFKTFHSRVILTNFKTQKEKQPLQNTLQNSDWQSKHE